MSFDLSEPLAACRLRNEDFGLRIKDLSDDSSHPQSAIDILQSAGPLPQAVLTIRQSTAVGSSVYWVDFANINLRKG